MNLGENGADQQIRDRLNRIACEPRGTEKLHEMLKLADPVSAARLHPNDVRRVVRALEVYETTGKPMSEMADTGKKEGPYHVMAYGLSYPRDLMYARINARVDQMMKDGLVDEVKSLLALGIEPQKEGGAMQAIGYKEIVSALRGDMDMERAVELIKQGSRRYAKRQWTWFRHDDRIQWFDFSLYENPNKLYEDLVSRIREDIASYNS